MNADGSTDIYFRLDLARRRQKLAQHDPGSRFSVILRLYGPTKAFFEQKWKAWRHRKAELSGNPQ